MAEWSQHNELRKDVLENHSLLMQNNPFGTSNEPELLYSQLKQSPDILARSRSCLLGGGGDQYLLQAILPLPPPTADITKRSRYHPIKAFLINPSTLLPHQSPADGGLGRPRHWPLPGSKPHVRKACQKPHVSLIMQNNQTFIQRSIGNNSMGQD